MPDVSRNNTSFNFTTAERAMKLHTLVCNPKAAEAISTGQYQSLEGIDDTRFPDVD